MAICVQNLGKLYQDEFQYLRIFGRLAHLAWCAVNFLVTLPANAWTEYSPVFGSTYSARIRKRPSARYGALVSFVWIFISWIIIARVILTLFCGINIFKIFIDGLGGFSIRIHYTINS
ncbi:hypothetical protein WCLP8_4170009 [uncultured Gammaproteobacteria bacterium]